ncbi:hypothetical protein, partial [Streptosporangium vulgare]|uniref:hypothetical protein n=1 Tax=Streptosporangium vulgare TaxID=46190 RepID=UPI0031D4DD6A
MGTRPFTIRSSVVARPSFTSTTYPRPGLSSHRRIREYEAPWPPPSARYPGLPRTFSGVAV